MEERLVVIVDCSGSMSFQTGDMVGALNAAMDQFSQDAAKKNTAVHIELVLFADAPRTFYSGPLTATHPRLAREDYEPFGGTALYDTLAPWLKEEKNTTFIILTDGDDTTSKVYTSRQTIELVQHAKREGKCQFIFLAQGAEALVQGRSLGMHSQHVASLSETVQSQDFLQRASQALFDKLVEEAEEEEPAVVKRQKLDDAECIAGCSQFEFDYEDSPAL